MDEDEVLREMKEEEEKDEEGEMMEDLETSLRRTAEVLNGYRFA